MTSRGRSRMRRWRRVRRMGRRTRRKGGLAPHLFMHVRIFMHTCIHRRLPVDCSWASGKGGGVQIPAPTAQARFVGG
eukprot:1944034-Pyramimonas_sp.AAC.1